MLMSMGGGGSLEGGIFVYDVELEFVYALEYVEGGMIGVFTTLEAIDTALTDIAVNDFMYHQRGDLEISSRYKDDNHFEMYGWMRRYDITKVPLNKLRYY